MTCTNSDAGAPPEAAAAAESRALSWKLKSVTDPLAAFLLLVAVAPLMAAVALAVKLESPGPVFFRQPRYGIGPTRILVTKFRTMRRAGAGDRVTRVGRFLRRTSLDDLPQLWDVLRGRMSLVGPRPHPLALEVEGQPIEKLIQNYHARHRVRPGITGLAQVRGNHGPVESLAMARERLAYDLEYIDRHSLRLDLAILFRTLGVPFRKDGSG
jgi:lipopolysaccharide/colanic/teichoic acid biosynthesis glycosyltransferase